MHSSLSLPLLKLSQAIFASDPKLGISVQLAWTKLSQGFGSSATIFREALKQDLNLFHSEYPEITLLQYEDDLLLAAKDEEDYL